MTMSKYSTDDFEAQEMPVVVAVAQEFSIPVPVSVASSAPYAPGIRWRSSCCGVLCGFGIRWQSWQANWNGHVRLHSIGLTLVLDRSRSRTRSSYRSHQLYLSNCSNGVCIDHHLWLLPCRWLQIQLKPKGKEMGCLHASLPCWQLGCHYYNCWRGRGWGWRWCTCARCYIFDSLHSRCHVCGDLHLGPKIMW